MYSFPGYASMLTDSKRVAAFREAIGRVVTPGTAVLELGAGPGIFSVIAARQGASRVYAIDPSPLVTLTGQAAERNGVLDRVEVHRCLSSDWTPTGAVDVVVHDLRGTLPFFRGSLRTLTDLRTRLTPRATWIPACDRVYAALVSCPGSRSELIDVWQRCDENLDANIYTATALNNSYKVRIKPDAIVSDAHLLATLDYGCEFSVDLNASTTWTISDPVRTDGVAAWFDSMLAEGIRYTSGPENPSSTYRQTFFPFPRPLTFSPGDVLSWSLHAMDVGPDYIWWWHTNAALTTGERLQWRQGSLDLTFAEVTRD